MVFSQEMKMWMDLVQSFIATDEELELVTSINGLNMETLNDVLYVRTGYRDWDQFVESEM